MSDPSSLSFNLHMRCWCYNCARVVSSVGGDVGTRGRGNLLCPICGDGFLERINGNFSIAGTQYAGISNANSQRADEFSIAGSQHTNEFELAPETSSAREFAGRGGSTLGAWGLDVDGQGLGDTSSVSSSLDNALSSIWPRTRGSLPGLGTAEDNGGHDLSGDYTRSEGNNPPALWSPNSFSSMDSGEENLEEVDGGAAWRQIDGESAVAEEAGQEESSDADSDATPSDSAGVHSQEQLSLDLSLQVFSTGRGSRRDGAARGGGGRGRRSGSRSVTNRRSIHLWAGHQTEEAVPSAGEPGESVVDGRVTALSGSMQLRFLLHGAVGPMAGTVGSTPDILERERDPEAQSAALGRTGARTGGDSGRGQAQGSRPGVDSRQGHGGLLDAASGQASSGGAGGLVVELGSAAPRRGEGHDARGNVEPGSGLVSESLLQGSPVFPVVQGHLVRTRLRAIAAVQEARQQHIAEVERLLANEGPELGALRDSSEAPEQDQERVLGVMRDEEVLGSLEQLAHLEVQDGPGEPGSDGFVTQEETSPSLREWEQGVRSDAERVRARRRVRAPGWMGPRWNRRSLRGTGFGAFPAPGYDLYGDYVHSAAEYQAVLDQLLREAEEAEIANGGAGNLPACKQVVASLPRFTVGAGGTNADFSGGGDGGRLGDLRCTVCREDMVEGDEAMELPCQHCFHSLCILPWFEMHCTCPLCRYLLPAARGDIPPSPGAAQAAALRGEGQAWRQGVLRLRRVNALRRARRGGGLEELLDDGTAVDMVDSAQGPPESLNAANEEPRPRGGRSGGLLTGIVVPALRVACVVFAAIALGRQVLPCTRPSQNQALSVRSTQSASSPIVFSERRELRGGFPRADQPDNRHTSTELALGMDFQPLG